MASKTADMFTRDAVKAAGAVEVKAMIANIKSRISRMRNADTELRIAAAYTIWTVFQTREKVSPTALAEELGLAPSQRSNVYFWKRLGIAIVDLGVEPNTEVWTMLNASANVKIVAQILDGKGRDGKGEGKVAPTMDDLMWALNIVFPVKDDGTREGRQSAKQIEAALVKEGLVEAPEPEKVEKPAEVMLTIEQRAKGSVEYLINNFDSISDDAWPEIDGLLRQVFNLGRVRNGQQPIPTPKKTAERKSA